MQTRCKTNQQTIKIQKENETVNLDKIEKLVKIIENSSMLDFSIQEGDVKNGTVMAGQIAGLISKEQTCKEMIEEMMDQTEKLLGRC